MAAMNAPDVFRSTQGMLCPDRRVGALLLHGLTGVPSEMRPIARHLQRIGVTTECPLLPGHGGTYKDMLACGWQDWLEGAREALERLAESCDEIMVVGLSMGALLATALAAEDSRVSGVVLLSPTIRYDGSAVSDKFGFLLPLVDVLPFMSWSCYWTEEPPYGLKDQRLQRMITRQVEAARKGEKTDYGSFRTYAGSLRQLQHLVKHVKKIAAEVTCPALIMHSKEDTLTSTRNATQMHSWLGSSEKQLMLFDGSDHVMTVDLRKREVASRVAHFATRLSWAESTGEEVLPVEPIRDQGEEPERTGILKTLTGFRTWTQGMQSERT